MTPSPRRQLYGVAIPILLASLLPMTGCGSADSNTSVDRVIGRRGLMPGEFVKPRAIAIDRAGNLAVVDFRAMIQWLAPDGQPIAHWESPDHTNGRPSGLGLDPQENLLVADSHYHQILVYDRAGKLLRQYGGDTGEGPLVGRFGYIADVEADAAGNIYIAESQHAERITKINPAGEILAEWGGLGSEPGQFQRIRAMAFDRQGRLLVADACNHRIQIFNTDGRFLGAFGSAGQALGQMMYPYDIAVAPDGDLYVCEYGNSRVQRFTPDGQPKGFWGQPGRGPGELWNPWALDIDSHGRLYVVDSNNHRLQRFLIDN